MDVKGKKKAGLGKAVMFMLLRGSKLRRDVVNNYEQISARMPRAPARALFKARNNKRQPISPEHKGRRLVRTQRLYNLSMILGSYPL